MNNNHQALWDDCLRLIRANVTEQQFKTWVAASQYVRIRVSGAALRWIIK